MPVRPLVLAGAAAVALAIGLGVALVRNTGPATPAAGSATPAGGPAVDAVQLALRAGKPTVAEFGANACASCREMKPVLEAVRRDHGERFAVVEVDLIKQKEGAHIQRYRIQLMPTPVFFDALGKEASRNIGRMSAEDIVARMQGGGS